MTSRKDLAATESRFAKRLPILESLAVNIETEVKRCLLSVEHVDRVYFRAKKAKSFAEKAHDVDREGRPRYVLPFEDIEDQVAGRVLVFYRRDIGIVADRLSRTFNRAEQTRKAPQRHDSFAYESEHLVFIIPPHLVPDNWGSVDAMPNTFEMQIRTLFMHAWAEPEHDISYKSKVPITHEEKRKLAWAASSAWGGDEIFEQVLVSISSRDDESMSESDATLWPEGTRDPSK